MSTNRRQVALLGFAALAFPSLARATPAPPPIFALPAGTPGRPFYESAIGADADFLAAPVSVASDGALVVAPDIELSAFTDVAAFPGFADRRRQRTLGGTDVSGWFVDDFTLAELKTLATGSARKTGRAPPAPPSLLSLQELVEIARNGSVTTARTIGVAPRLVRPAYFNARELGLETRLADFISRQGYDSPAAAMIVHAADPAALRTLAGLTRVRRVQIMGADGGPDDPAAPRFAAMATADGLAQVRTWAGAVAPAENLVIGQVARGAITSTGFVQSAHGAGLKVFARVDAAKAGGRGGSPLRPRLEALILAGADGIECEDVATAARARSDALDRLRHRAGLD